MQQKQLNLRFECFIINVQRVWRLSFYSTFRVSLTGLLIPSLLYSASPKLSHQYSLRGFRRFTYHLHVTHVASTYFTCTILLNNWKAHFASISNKLPNCWSFSCFFCFVFGVLFWQFAIQTLRYLNIDLHWTLQNIDSPTVKIEHVLTFMKQIDF